MKCKFKMVRKKSREGRWRGVSGELFHQIRREVQAHCAHRVSSGGPPCSDSRVSVGVATCVGDRLQVSPALGLGLASAWPLAVDNAVQQGGRSSDTAGAG